MRVIVGVSDMKVSANPGEELVTYSLGSCIGIVIYDPVVKVGGILHYMLPESSLDPEKAGKNPYMFADTGIPALFKASYALGAKKQRMKVVIAGGAQILDQQGFFNIGKRNHMAVKKMFFRNNVIANHEDVGGNVNRTVRLKIVSGDIHIKVGGEGEKKL
ncbi:chemotaxis protein CheD [Desulfobotulus alkaliphilus]|uniref:Probable chemoreceptor glutamine deamidase CheD n=1 Tax=Desulfobotulus alkaliphilus TaxID=622671 RepID=A0A562R682_9BACT|nr:chemotaxis protein CheD [Desulfobotulus alkaliphilus]TWI63930.1 chemotaxis protein CheD [Desulfobotulus alkaliphilus]